MKRYSLDYGMSFGHCTADMNEDDDGEWVKVEDLPGWQPIDTAPTDGSRVDLWIPRIDSSYGGFSSYGHWDDDRFNRKPRPLWYYERAVDRSSARCLQPTHWRPSPEPPK